MMAMAVTNNSPSDCKYTIFLFTTKQNTRKKSRNVAKNDKRPGKGTIFPGRLATDAKSYFPGRPLNWVLQHLKCRSYNLNLLIIYNTIIPILHHIGINRFLRVTYMQMESFYRFLT